MVLERMWAAPTVNRVSPRLISAKSTRSLRFLRSGSLQHEDDLAVRLGSKCLDRVVDHRTGAGAIAHLGLPQADGLSCRPEWRGPMSAMSVGRPAAVDRKRNAGDRHGSVAGEKN